MEHPARRPQRVAPLGNALRGHLRLQAGASGGHSAAVMNRLSFLRLASASLAGALLVSCTTAPVSSVPAAWPPAAYSTVRAFVYDCDADRTVAFFQKDGSISRGVINAPGALLTPDQVKRLMPALTTATPRQHRTACFIPHHALVFYNAAGQVVAHTEVCFTCTLQRSSPAGLPEHIDFQTVWDILREAGVPCGDGSQFYKDLYKARQAGR